MTRRSEPHVIECPCGATVRLRVQPGVIECPCGTRYVTPLGTPLDPVADLGHEPAAVALAAQMYRERTTGRVPPVLRVLPADESS